MSILNRIYFDSDAKLKAPASPAKGRRSNERMCFDPASPFNGKLKETLFKMMEESKQ